MQEYRFHRKFAHFVKPKCLPALQEYPLPGLCGDRLKPLCPYHYGLNK